MASATAIQPQAPAQTEGGGETETGTGAETEAIQKEKGGDVEEVESSSSSDDLPAQRKGKRNVIILASVLGIFLAIALAISITALVYAMKGIQQTQAASDSAAEAEASAAAAETNSATAIATSTAAATEAQQATVAAQQATASATAASEKADSAAQSAYGNPAINGGLSSAGPSQSVLFSAVGTSTQTWNGGTQGSSIGHDVSIWEPATSSMAACDGTTFTGLAPGWYLFQPLLPLSFNTSNLTVVWNWNIWMTGATAWESIGSISTPNSFNPSSSGVTSSQITYQGENQLYVPVSNAQLRLRGSVRGTGVVTLLGTLNVKITKMA